MAEIHNEGKAAPEKFLELLSHIVMQSGIGFNTPISIQTENDDGEEEAIMITPAQLIYNLTTSMGAVSQSLDDIAALIEEESIKAVRTKRRTK